MIDYKTTVYCLKNVVLFESFAGVVGVCIHLLKFLKLDVAI